jgi:adenylate cyclase
LTEATSGCLVWSETYDTKVDTLFAVQEKIAKHVVGAAAVKLARFEQGRALAKPTTKLAAYEYVLRGREVFSQETRDDNDEAIELFKRAIDLDPNYADAYAALAASHYFSVTSGWAEFRERELKRAEALALKALELDPAPRGLITLWPRSHSIGSIRPRAGADRPRVGDQSEWR